MNIKRFLQPMYKPEPNGGTSKKYLNARVQMKKDTAANWEAANPVILAGEFIIVTTANGETRFKVGDGTKRYTQLPYTDEPLRSLVGEKLGKTEAAAKVQNKLNIFGQEYDGSAPITIDVIEDATTTQSGLMSAADKKTLGDITPLVVTFTISSDGGSYTSDKTYAQIKEANDNGRFIYGVLKNGTQLAGWLDCIYLNKDYFEFKTQCRYNISSKQTCIQIITLTLYENNSIYFHPYNVPSITQTETIASSKITESFENIDGIIKRENLNGTFIEAVAGTDYAAATHTHTIEQVTDLETRLAALEAKETGTKVTLYRYVSA